MIKTILFDFGGVIITLDQKEAMRRFGALGVPDVEKRLDAYTQAGMFGDVEDGRLSADGFVAEMSAMCGKEVTWEECKWAWTGYKSDLPKRNIDILRKLRNMGYRLVMVSNTNPFMMAWACSSEFSRGLDDECPEGKPVSDYFDACYKSYEIGAMKPSERYFRHVLEHEGISPSEALFVDDGAKNIEMAASLGFRTLCPVNGEDWTGKLMALLEKENNM
ncbi:HAD family phosphatase [Prevotella sp. PINT]|jgi:haloacid dehalogenase superfamily, subfamily IA, variant 3 with third motif having DD or ED|uniref:HAD family hydrolase n=1 Tax=Palleniella intestinalis TaxID=2736291 RepID=UPI001551D62E|nr:HAD family phosphatase [Palleniella intestinalis]NPD80763.1 HAD family phosphatase [Palleniella intestinalis]